MCEPVAAATVVTDPSLKRVMERNALWRCLQKAGLDKLLMFCGESTQCFTQHFGDNQLR